MKKTVTGWEAVSANRTAGRLLAWTAALAVAMAGQQAGAQAVPDPEGTIYTTGAVFETEE